eukprot:CAMPEP_0202882398 /NCGR_PEP_ID=MMETSP1391-20130828/37939_1 /ASSEMBLY_ACC=CAM_ASM_000867 /TAXON_ID=1034604 /ORGANISM="Chlamydomonas leiostraca, Strain SAG 11-49" /LENGTH=158 /DNA_ID=CAMNT_0049565249 /DNA_START=45 /DNA_END=518 /DNA_ORIENTATION=+
MARVEASGVHLVVLQHGMWGYAANLSVLEEEISKAAAERGASNVEIFSCRTFEGDGTYAGIDACGDMLVDALTRYVCDLKHAGRPVSHLTLIGYSLGGLIVRYAAGKLWAMGWLGPGSSSTSTTSTAKSSTAGSHTRGVISTGDPVTAGTQPASAAQD